MIALKCKLCGGDVVGEASGTLGRCEHCGTATTLPRVSDERRTNLYNRANHLRRLCEFDKAVAAYEAILAEDNTEAEAHWGVVLSRYGIEYVEEPASGARVPTCHRVQGESVLRDADYLMALEHAPDPTAKAHYEEEGRRIAEIQRGILAVSAQESPYDVFVCYKETTDGGSRSADSVLAQEIHQHLTERNLRVFFARVSLEGVLGQKYEPYIYAALNSARVMVVVGTKVEHFNAVWVRNEWGRFLQLRRKEKGKVLIPCYKGMNPYELPGELAELQCQDMGRLGFMQDLVRGVEKVLGHAKPVEKAGGSGSGSGEVAGWLKRAWLFLEDGDFDSAKQYAERVLDRDPETGEAYWVKALADLQVRREAELANRRESLATNRDYQKAIRFGTVELKRRLEELERDIASRRLQEIRRQEEERRLAEEARVRAEAEERDQHQRVLAKVKVLVADGDLKKAEVLLATLKSRLTGLDYEGAAQGLQGALEARGKVESGLKGALEGLQAAEGAAPKSRLLVTSDHVGACSQAREKAAEALGTSVRYLESASGPSADLVRGLMEEVRGADRRVAECALHMRVWVRRWVAVKLGLLLAIMLVPVIGWQRERAAERERQRVAAAQAKAEDEARQKAEAEARARAKAEAEAKLKRLAEAKVRLMSPNKAPGERHEVGMLSVRWIPAGRFVMGSPESEEGRSADELQHEVVFTHGFFMAETECTQTQWESVMGNGPIRSDGDRPVENVSWAEATEFCRQLTRQQQLSESLPAGWAWRLPTEAEWEYAARAGTAGPYSGELMAIAWYKNNSGNDTYPVKRKQPNSWGLHDMLGNVWEWCADWYGAYPQETMTDPVGPSSGSYRVMRGGSCISDAVMCRSANRDHGVGSGSGVLVTGFRAVLAPTQP